MLDTIPFTSVHSNLEHELAILTESFSPLRSVLHNLDLDMCQKPILTSSCLMKPVTATKVDTITEHQMPSGNSIVA